MNKKKISILVFIYNSYKDPLFQNLLLSYIKTLSSARNYRFDLITFEQEQYPMTPEEIKNEKTLLIKHNIYWHPKKFHTGRFLLFKKLYDVIVTLFTVFRIKWLYHSNYVFAFANVSAAFSILFSKIIQTKLVIYSYEPHSEFMTELGIWTKDSLKFKILSYLERMAGEHASHVMTGTKHGVQLLNSYGSKAKIYRAPTAVDDADFYFRDSGRQKVRKKHNIADQQVFLYMGKFGDLYFKEEVADLFLAIYTFNKSAHFIMVTTYDHEEINQWMKSRNVPSTSYSLTKDLTNEEVKEYLSAADMGISAVPPSPSQKYRSPTKIAEYLLCGLPYITCVGISEDDDYAIKNKVGVVLQNFNKSEINAHYNEILLLLSEDKSALRERCRMVGLEYRSKKHIDHLLESIFL